MRRIPSILLLTAFGWICVLYGGWEWAIIGCAGCIIGGVVAVEMVRDRPIPLPTIIRIGHEEQNGTERTASQGQDDPGR